MTRLLVLLSLTLFLTQLSFAQITESHVDYSIGTGVIQDGNIQYAHEWLEPHQFKNKEMRSIDLLGISDLNPNNTKLIAAKVAFISKKTFDQLSYIQMNNAEYISEMLDAVGARNLSADSWRITNKVKAYGLPFKVTFDFKLKEVSASAIGRAANYLRDETYGLKGSGRERFLTLDMSNFSMLMYRNYCLVYIKEISATETVVVAGVIAGIDSNKASTYFPLGPRSSMLGNMKTQVMSMARNIQKAK